MTIIPLAPPSLAGSSNLPGSIRRAVLLPYLVLLRAGFCLPPMLPPARCALTAPFHPYLNRGPERPAIGAVCFLCHCPSSCPDRGLPGALPCGVRTFLPAFAPCGAPARRPSVSLRRSIVQNPGAPSRLPAWRPSRLPAFPPKPSCLPALL